MMNQNLVIEAKQLTKTFRDFWHRPRVRAVRELSFSVRRGEIFGLLGPNGSGKSTTIKMILGLLHPTTGSLRVLNQPPDHVPTKERIGYLPEDSYLYPYLTCEETIDFFGHLFDLSTTERRKRVEELLTMIGLEQARKRVVGDFSKGMSRRIGLAQALINDPDLVILDEPTSGLDPLGCRQIKDLILALAQRGKTILLTSHLLADVEDVCDRIAILYSGRLQAMGAVDDLLEKQHSYQLSFSDLPQEKLDTLLQQVRTTTGETVHLERPQRNLEQYFLDVIRKARDENGETSGATTGDVAPYLQQNETNVHSQS